MVLFLACHSQFFTGLSTVMAALRELHPSQVHVPRRRVVSMEEAIDNMQEVSPFVTSWQGGCGLAKLKVGYYPQSLLFTTHLNYMQDQLWTQTEAEAAYHCKTVLENAFENTPEENFIRVTLPTRQENFYGSSHLANFVRAVLRCEWTCSDVVFVCSGFNATLRLHNCFKDYFGHRNCFLSRMRDIFPYKISVFNPHWTQVYVNLCRHFACK